VITVVVFVAYRATCEGKITYLWYSRDTTKHSFGNESPFELIIVSYMYMLCLSYVNVLICYTRHDLSCHVTCTLRALVLIC
jgi:hypothetical protein